LTTPGHDPRWDDEVDLLVIGGGAAGMTAALVGSIEGLRTMPCEKTEMVGGTTATSAGTVWIPGSSQSSRAEISDSVEQAKRYLRAVVGAEAQDRRLAAAGLRTDENGSVPDRQGKSIEGLYVVGNDAASVFRGTYPGPGTMLGPAIVFGWRAAMHAANRTSPAENSIR
jgi:succinate dehydrogenase/fumarate reductase flavoprotein subunit